MPGRHARRARVQSCGPGMSPDNPRAVIVADVATSTVAVPPPRRWLRRSWWIRRLVCCVGQDRRYWLERSRRLSDSPT